MEQVQDGGVPEAFFFLKVNRLKDFQDFFRIQKTYEGFLGAFLRNVEDSLSKASFFRVEKANHFGQGFKRCQALVSGGGLIAAF